MSTSAITVVLSSEIFMEFSIRDISMYNNPTKDPSSLINFYKKNYMLPPGCLSELQYINITPEEVVKLIEKVQKLVMSTKEGTQYEVERLFLPDDKRVSKVKGMPPGVIRVFSKDLASYYTGKSWKKLELPQNV